MSVDQRIREGLTMTDQQLRPADTETAYDVVVHGAAERTTTQRAVTGAISLAAAAAVAVVALQYDMDAPVGPVPSDRTSQTAAAPEVLSLANLQGVWQTHPVEFSAMADHLHEQGLGQYVGQVRGGLGFARTGGVEHLAPVVFVLTFNDDRVTLTMNGVEIDLQTPRVSDGLLYLNPPVAPGGRTRFSVVLDRGSLRLSFIDTTVGPSGGVPEEVYANVLYTTVSFQRVSGE